jgi:ATP-dependent Zn protease
MVMSEEEKKVTAWHEAGHAVASHFIAGNDPCTRSPSSRAARPWA